MSRWAAELALRQQIMINRLCICACVITSVINCGCNNYPDRLIITGTVCNEDNSSVNSFEIGWKNGLLAGKDHFTTSCASRDSIRVIPGPPVEFKRFVGNTFELEIVPLSSEVTVFVKTQNDFHGIFEIQNINSEGPINISCYPLEKLIQKVVFAPELQIEFENDYIFVKDASKINNCFNIIEMYILEGQIDQSSVFEFKPILHGELLNKSVYKFNINALIDGIYTVVAIGTKDKEKCSLSLVSVAHFSKPSRSVEIQTGK